MSSRNQPFFAAGRARRLVGRESPGGSVGLEIWDDRRMKTQVRGVVHPRKGAPVEVMTVLVPDPGPGEALVRVQACGVCHTDLHYREGGIGDDFPYLLGHEAAGVVEAVGGNVTSVGPGDFVILNWRAVCGQCRACKRGRPWYCFNTHNATQKMTLADGSPLSPALGIGAFVEKTAGARTIIAVDIDPRKLEWARGFGATHVINSKEADPVAGIRELTGGNGADVVIEAIGRPETYQQAFYARDLAGTVVLVGVPTPEMRLDLPLLDFFGRGRALQFSWFREGSSERDSPLLTGLYLQGRLPLEKFVSETIALDAVEEAVAKMERGEVLRSVVKL